MNYRHIEVFFAVMTAGTVTEAARQLGVSQPSVTTTLKQAEARLGLTLFQREGGRLIPTAEARILFEEAERAHDALASFKVLARRLQVGRGGHVRIAAIPSISLELLPGAVDRFQQKHPGFNFSISTLNTEEILAQLDTRTGTFHLGLTFGQVDDEHVATEQIGEAELLAVVPSSWGLPAGEEIPLSNLADRPYVAGFDGTALARACGGLFLDAGIEPQIVARIHTHLLAGRLAQRGVGFAILDSVTVRALLHDRRSDQVTIHRISGRPGLPVSAIFPGQRALTNPARLFLDCVRDAYESLSATVEERLP